MQIVSYYLLHNVHLAAAAYPLCKSLPQLFMGVGGGHSIAKIAFGNPQMDWAVFQGVIGYG